MNCNEWSEDPPKMKVQVDQKEEEVKSNLALAILSVGFTGLMMGGFYFMWVKLHSKDP
jgi:hypothetical protein